MSDLGFPKMFFLSRTCDLVNIINWCSCLLPFSLNSDFSFIDGYWCCTRITDEGCLNFPYKAPQRDDWPIFWTPHSDAFTLFSNGQGSQSSKVQREKEDKKIWEDNQVCLKEGLCRDQTQNKGSIRQENRCGSWSGSDVLHNTNYRSWIWHCSLFLNMLCWTKMATRQRRDQ